ncbi:MAG: ribonuclease H-like domain-containing protein [Lachnospiraceae bacterium]|nr:ribonuclease H-like domain-containing protein [Lachnospiraceae bacterium]
MPMNYVAFDIETTGLSPKYEKIIEIGAVRVRDGKVQETFSTFVNPGKGLPARIVELTGIHDADVADAPYIDEVLETFLAFAGDDVLLGHNLLFDYSFMKKAAVNQKKTFEKSGIDTLRIARRFLNDMESRSLGFLCEHYHIFLEAHRALNDAAATHELYQILAREYGNREQDIFQPVPLVYNVKKENPATSRQIAYLKGLAERYQLECDGLILAPVAAVTDEQIDLETISKNEASRLIDRLLAAFGR